MLFIIKNILRIIKDYNITLVKIIFFELVYFIKGYKGFKFDFSNNNKMTDNIPCPYYLLLKMKKYLKKNDFLKLCDLGCGSGRVIDFFRRSFPNKEFIGIEYFSKQFNYCSKNFQNNNNVKIINADFTKIDVIKNNPNYFFLTAPFKDSDDFVNFMEKTISFSNKKLFFIIVNYNIETIKRVKNIEFLESFYISKDTGYSICRSVHI